jgi:hypothetical protein
MLVSTTISEPLATEVVPEPERSRVGRMLDTLAAFAYQYGPGPSGPDLRTALTAVLLAGEGMSPAEAIDAACYEAFDDVVRAAGDERDCLINAARAAALAAEQDGGQA